MQNIIGYSSSEEIIAEIKATWESFKIDDVLIRNKIFEELKSFRDAACMSKFDYIHIHNKRAEVPKDFQSLIDAEYVLPDKIVSFNLPYEKIVKSRIYSLREPGFNYVEKEFCCEVKKANCNDVCECSEELYEEETIENEVVLFYYKQPVKGCVVPYVSGAKHKQGCPFEISYFNGEFITNIENGTIKIHYNGIPTDENNFPLIPTTHDDSVRKFLLTAISKALLESPSMIVQKDAGFNDIYKVLQPVVYSSYAGQRSQALLELSRLSLREIAQFVAKRRRDRYNKYFAKYSGL